MTQPVRVNQVQALLGAIYRADIKTAAGGRFLSTDDAGGLREAGSLAAAAELRRPGIGLLSEKVIGEAMRSSMRIIGNVNTRGKSLLSSKEAKAAETVDPDYGPTIRRAYDVIINRNRLQANAGSSAPATNAALVRAIKSDFEGRRFDLNTGDLNMRDAGVRNHLPADVVDSHDYFADKVIGWGRARLFATQVDVGGEPTAVHFTNVTTDGDDGYFEIFVDGKAVASGQSQGGAFLSWDANVRDVRAAVAIWD